MKTRRRQKGLALIALVFILVLAATTYVVKSLDANNLKNLSDKRTASALAEAKAALIGYAVLDGSTPGALPCPDTNNNGTSDVLGAAPKNCAGYISRLPWKTLGGNMLKDNSGECLWYALSPAFRNSMPVTPVYRGAAPLNGTNLGSITLVNDADTPIAGANPVIAVIFAPNYPVTGQNRSGAATSYCPGDSIATNYLDTKGAVNNATGNNPPLIGVSYRFKKGFKSNSFNDGLIYMTAKEFFPLLRKRITKEIVGKVDVPSGLFKYYQTPATLNTYPCPAKTVVGNADCVPPLGNNLPYNDSVSPSPLKYISLGNWLINNGWFPMTTYNYISATHVRVTVTDPFGSYACDANMNVVTCT